MSIPNEKTADPILPYAHPHRSRIKTILLVSFILTLALFLLAQLWIMPSYWYYLVGYGGNVHAYGYFHYLIEVPPPAAPFLNLDTRGLALTTASTIAILIIATGLIWAILKRLQSNPPSSVCIRG